MAEEDHSDRLPMLPKHRFYREEMLAYCAERGASLLRVLQPARPAKEAKPGVALILDNDGIAKVLKEELPHGDPDAGPHERESSLLAAVAGLPFVPRLYGVEDWHGIRIMRQSVAYGRDLLDCCPTVQRSELSLWLRGIRDMLAEVHSRGVSHRDVWPRNFTIEGDRLSLIDFGDARFIDADNDKAAEDIAELRGWIPFIEQVQALDAAPVGRRTFPELGMALFPARMGIPHKGHIDYMSRVMELGYPLVISLQGAYTTSAIDPLPKWQVMKMVAASLRRRGFVADKDFRFVFTPLFENDEQHRMHFAMMPDFDKVAIVASGNEDVHALFAALPKLDQCTVFGHEGEPYTPRSWGEQLRKAARDGDDVAFRQLAADGVLELLSFERVQAACREAGFATPLRQVVVCVHDDVRGEMVRGRAARYLSPQETAVQLLGTLGKTATLTDLYAYDTLITLDGVPYRLCDAGTSVTEDGKLNIRFELV